jgi:hypothetical protein
MTPSDDGSDGCRFKGSSFLAQSAALNRAFDAGRQDDAAPVAGWEKLAERNAAGVDLLRQDRAVEAATAFRDVVADCSETLGPEHPDTLVATGNLAVAHAHAGQLAEAMGLLEVNLASRVAVFGDVHPRTLDARDTLGTMLRLVGRAADAAVVHALVVRQRALALGPEHPDTLVSRLGLALDAAEAGSLDPSAAALAQLLNDADAAFGPRHDLTTIIRAAAAAVALALGQVDQAVKQLQMAYSAAESVHGPAHRDAVALRAELADAMAARSGAEPSRPSDQLAEVTSPREPSATRGEPDHHRRQDTDR